MSQAYKGTGCEKMQTQCDERVLQRAGSALHLDVCLEVVVHCCGQCEGVPLRAAAGRAAVALRPKANEGALARDWRRLAIVTEDTG